MPNPIFSRRAVNPVAGPGTPTAAGGDLTGLARLAAAEGADLLATAAQEAKDAAIAKASQHIIGADGKPVALPPKPASGERGYVFKDAYRNTLVRGNLAIAETQLAGLTRRVETLMESDVIADRDSAMKLWTEGAEGIRGMLGTPQNAAAVSIVIARTTTDLQAKLESAKQSARRGESFRARMTHWTNAATKVTPSNWHLFDAGITSEQSGYVPGSDAWNEYEKMRAQGNKVLAEAALPDWVNDRVDADAKFPAIEKTLREDMEGAPEWQVESLVDGARLMAVKRMRENIGADYAMDIAQKVNDKVLTQQEAIEDQLAFGTLAPLKFPEYFALAKEAGISTQQAKADLDAEINGTATDVKQAFNAMKALKEEGEAADKKRETEFANDEHQRNLNGSGKDLGLNASVDEYKRAREKYPELKGKLDTAFILGEPVWRNFFLDNRGAGDEPAKKAAHEKFHRAMDAPITGGAYPRYTGPEIDEMFEGAWGAVEQIVNRGNTPRLRQGFVDVGELEGEIRGKGATFESQTKAMGALNNYNGRDTRTGTNILHTIQSDESLPEVVRDMARERIVNNGWRGDPMQKGMAIGLQLLPDLRVSPDGEYGMKKYYSKWFAAFGKNEAMAGVYSAVEAQARINAGVGSATLTDDDKKSLQEEMVAIFDANNFVLENGRWKPSLFAGGYDDASILLDPERLNFMPSRSAEIRVIEVDGTENVADAPVLETLREARLGDDFTTELIDTDAEYNYFQIVNKVNRDLFVLADGRRPFIASRRSVAASDIMARRRLEKLPLGDPTEYYP